MTINSLYVDKSTGNSLNFQELYVLQLRYKLRENKG